jgi:PAS domain S-box-containing protein
MVWSALLGILADSLTTAQEIAIAAVTIVSGIFLWTAVRALIFQQRFFAQQKDMKALEASRAFLQVLMDNLPAAVWLKSCDHRYLAGNIMWAEFNPVDYHWQGDTVDDLVGHTDRELYNDARAAEFERTDDTVVTSGQRWEHEYDESLDGGHRIYRVLKVPVFDRWGSVTNIAGMGFDVTERVRTAAEIRQFSDQVRLFLDRSPEHVCVIGTDQIIQLANVRMCVFLGMHSSELVGKDLMDFVMPADRERFAAFVERTLADGSAPYEKIQVPDASGVPRRLGLSGVLLTPRGMAARIVIIGRELTERKDSLRQDA